MKTKEKTFNLVTQQWIPTTDGLYSLSDVFSAPVSKSVSLGGQPHQKAAVLRLLIAIAGIANPVDDDASWASAEKSFGKTVLRYLKDNESLFDLYDDKKPFGQDASLKGDSYSTGLLDLTRNLGAIAVMFSSQHQGKEKTDAELALDLVTYLNFATKETKGYRKGNPGHALGAYGMLHTFFSADNLVETIYLNALTVNDVKDRKYGSPMWESRPVHDSYLGCLFPQGRKIKLLGDGTMRMAEGKSISGVLPPPSATVYITKPNKGANAKKDDDGHRVLYVNGSKKSWREIPAMTKFFTSKGEGCSQLALPWNRVMRRAEKTGNSVGIVCWGISCTSGAFGQFFTGASAVVSSEYYDAITSINSDTYPQMVNNFRLLNDVSRRLEYAVGEYFRALKMTPAAIDGHKATASSMWWSRMESYSTALISELISDPLEKVTAKNLSRFIEEAVEILAVCCPTTSPRRYESFVKAEAILLRFKFNPTETK